MADTIDIVNVLSFDDFLRVDIRVGLVTSAEEVPKSKKLLKLEVNFGELGKRTIMAGIAQHYTPETITGLKVAAVVNLAPRQMMGVESHGMLLAGHGETDAVYLVTCPNIDIGGRLG